MKDNDVASTRNASKKLGRNYLDDSELDDDDDEARLADATEAAAAETEPDLFDNTREQGTSSTQHPSRPSKFSQSGHKTLFNFASGDIGAKVLSSNPEATGASRVLDENKDKYLLNPSSAKHKWLTIQLSEEIVMHSIALANFEQYSCSVKKFVVLGSTQYPCISSKRQSNDDRHTRVKDCNWEELGTFTATNSRRKVQTFLLQKPSVVRYIKLLFVSHYTQDEYYCTLSLVRVHGETLLDDLKDEFHREGSLDSVATDIPPVVTDATNAKIPSIEVDVLKHLQLITTEKSGGTTAATKPSVADQATQVRANNNSIQPIDSVNSQNQSEFRLNFFDDSKWLDSALDESEPQNKTRSTPSLETSDVLPEHNATERTNDTSHLPSDSIVTEQRSPGIDENQRQPQMEVEEQESDSDDYESTQLSHEDINRAMQTLMSRSGSNKQLGETSEDLLRILARAAKSTRLDSPLGILRSLSGTVTSLPGDSPSLQNISLPTKEPVPQREAEATSSEKPQQVEKPAVPPKPATPASDSPPAPSSGPTSMSQQDAGEGNVNSNTPSVSSIESPLATIIGSTGKTLEQLIALWKQQKLQEIQYQQSGNSRENILKALLLKIKRQDTEQMIHAIQVDKLQEKLLARIGDLSRVLDKNEADHNVLAQAIASLNKQVDTVTRHQDATQSGASKDELDVQQTISTLTTEIMSLRQDVEDYRSLLIKCLLALVGFLLVLMLSIAASIGPALLSSVASPKSTGSPPIAPQTLQPKQITSPSRNGLVGFVVAAMTSNKTAVPTAADRYTGLNQAEMSPMTLDPESQQTPSTPGDSIGITEVEVNAEDEDTDDEVVVHTLRLQQLGSGSHSASSPHIVRSAEPNRITRTIQQGTRTRSLSFDGSDGSAISQIRSSEMRHTKPLSFDTEALDQIRKSKKKKQKQRHRKP